MLDQVQHDGFGKAHVVPSHVAPREPAC